MKNVGDGVLDIPLLRFMLLVVWAVGDASPYKLYVRPSITRSAVERKQIMLSVQSKRVYERIVIAVKLASACLTSCGLCYIMVIDLFNRRMNLCFA